MKQEKTFKKMTRMQQRVAIAQDVLLQLKTEKVKARSGTYLWFNEADGRKLIEESKTEDA